MRRIAAALLALASCGGEGAVEQPPVETVRLVSVAPDAWLPGTPIEVRAEAFLPGDAAALVVDGEVANVRLRQTIPLTVQDGRTASGEAHDRLLNAGEGTFEGEATLVVTRDGGELAGTLPLVVELSQHLAPRLDRIGLEAAYFGDRIPLDGDGFLLPTEGALEAVFDGTFTPEGGAPVEVRGGRAPVHAVSRTRAELEVRPFFGLALGRFDGTLRVENVHAWDGTGIASEPLAHVLETLPPAVFEASPAVASRGQRLRFRGGGFVEDPADGISSLVRLRGTFTPRDGGVPETWSGKEVLGRVERSALAVTLAPRGNLDAFGGTPGTFAGQASVVVTRGAEELEGPETPLSFRVSRTRQIVFLKYLPGFDESLRAFGLRNAEREVKDRILEVCARDYEGFAVEFAEARPDDTWAEYAVIELTGEDPNGAGLFGLDNTEGKDDGNVRLDDVIGGRNAETEEQGSYAFGGVFVESFLSMSPSHPAPNPIASARFDAVFDPFRADRGGRPVEVEELSGGPRDAELREAIRVLGNVVGGTVVHEIGHSLGLAAVPGDPSAFHDTGEVPGLIMNPGASRSFEERAELDGLRAVWAEHDRAYLERVVPVD